MIDTKDAVVFARPDGALVLFLRAVRPSLPKTLIRNWANGETPATSPVERRTCYTAATSGERVQCQACGVSVRIVAEFGEPLRFICLDCEDRELAERASCAGNA